ncbi:hypothetical protein HF086_014532 [Spodoptera exigua]|uniref:CCHC-type domain-containing protein n=2 Tax=Spodoptera exigua TaxID=7107 RepID=A0A922SCL9_SPOEX|nr:hypothetical protein HF086_014532 [Spodoptera exigua]
MFFVFESQIMEQDRRGTSRHRLETPERLPMRRDGTAERRSRSRSRLRSGTRPPRRSRARSGSRGITRQSARSQSIREKERELRREWDKIRRLEDEIDRERSRLRSSSRTRRSSRHQSSVRNSEQRVEDRRGNREQSTARDNKRSASQAFSANDVMNILKSIKSTQSHTVALSSHNLNHKNILPDFDPSSKNQRVDVWLKKVNECATVYGWDDKTVIHFAMQKLQGLAKTWYESLNSILFSWSEWQDKLIAAFPYEQNYGQSLEDMLRRKSRPNEPIEVYFYEKIALLNQCDIDGKRAVDCVIHGLSDKTLKTSALALRCLHTDQLLQFLMSNKDSGHSQVLYGRGDLKNRFGQDSRAPGSGTSYDRTNTDIKKPNLVVNPGLFCYNCKERGHPFMKCPKPLLKCLNCQRFGHKTENCISKSDGLVYDCRLQPLKGFGNEIVNSYGTVIAKLAIDGVRAEVQFYVVDDKYLDTPVLVGQTFTEQPHVVVYKNSEQLKFSNFDFLMPFSDGNLGNTQDLTVTVLSAIDLYGPATITAVTKPQLNGDIIISSKIVGKPTNQYYIYGGVYRVTSGVVKISIAPIADSIAHLTAGATLCRATKVLLVNRILSHNFEDFAIDSQNFDDELVRMGEGVTEGRTPAEVMFGTSMNAELVPKLNDVRRNTQEYSDVGEIREQVKDKIQAEQIKQKEYYDRNRKPARTYKEET